MAQATQLDATEQDTLVKQIGLSLLRAAPRDWQRVTVEYRAVGRYHELTGEITQSDGSVTEWVATHDIATLFGRLRAGMYREGRGTWFNARYQLDHPSSYNLEYDREEPDWDLMPPGQAYVDELHMFPRSEENVPEWLLRRMSGLSPEPAEPRFRTARIFDGTDQSGRPVINRADLDPEEQEQLLDYLDNAPVVLPSRGYDIDRLSASQESTVPVAFHSDGTWIWPAAVNYYLREYGLTPETELVEHVHANAYTVPDVPDAQRQAAAAHINGGGQAQPQGGARHAPPPAPAAAEPATRQWNQAPAREPEPENGRAGAAGLDPATSFTPSPTFDAAPQTTVTPPVSDERGGHFDAEREHAEREHPGRHAEADDPEPILERLRLTLRELKVDDSAYRIGEPAQHGWSLERTDAGWRVGWYEERLTNPAVFGDVQDAAAFMLGKLLLAPGHEATQGAAAPIDAHAAEPAPPDTRQHATLPTELSAGPTAAPQSTQRPVPPPAAQEPPAGRHQGAQQDVVEHQEAAPPPSQQWPIQPLAGEPPLTLFRGKELRELPAGSELDRFGGPTGNLTYAAGTPFEERSLVPDWVNRPYHVYRVQRPLEALAGVAIPWFNQPGGGAAYMLPDSIEQHLAEGDLIELEAGEPPVD